MLPEGRNICNFNGSSMMAYVLASILQYALPFYLFVVAVVNI